MAILSSLALAGAIALLVESGSEGSPPAPSAPGGVPRLARAVASPPAPALVTPALATSPPAPDPAQRPLTVGELLARAAAATTTDELTAVMRTTHFALVEALARQPEALGELTRFIARGSPAAPATRIAVGALVAAGTPEIQAALVRLLDERPDDAAFARLMLPSLGALLHPAPATEAAVRALTGAAVPASIRSTAHLTLGTMAARLAASEPQRADAIVSGYAAQVLAASPAEDRARALTVLGNAGTPAAAAAITAQLDDRNAALRGRAVQALRRIATPEAEAQLRHALDDSDDGVRASAAWTLSYRMPSQGTLQVMTGKLATEPSDAVVSALLDTLWARRTEAPALIDAAVRGLASGHASPTIRARARELLAAAG